MKVTWVGVGRSVEFIRDGLVSKVSQISHVPQLFWYVSYLPILLVVVGTESQSRGENIPSGRIEYERS